MVRIIFISDYFKVISPPTEHNVVAMTDDLSMAMSLMGVGMITVFLVLAFVVIVGNLLIKFVNKFVPAAVKPGQQPKNPQNISPAKIAAIKSAIDQLTEGKGEVINIEKA